MKYAFQTLLRFITPFGAALFAIAAPASAQMWIASAPGQWHDPANWSPQVVPNAVGAEAFLASTAAGGSISGGGSMSFSAPITLGHLSVDMGFGGPLFFMNLGTLTLDNGGGADVTIFTTATGVLGISGQIVLMGNLVTDWRADNGQISADISGEYDVIIDSPQAHRRIRLAGVNTYTGDTVVRSGRLGFNSLQNLGDPSGAIIVEGDGTLILENLSEPVISGASFTLMDGGRIWTRAATWDDTITMVGAGEIAPLFDGFEALVSGQLTGDGTFIRGTAQSFSSDDPTIESILNVTNTTNDYTGGTIIRAGVLRIPGDEALGAAGTPITFQQAPGLSEGPGALVTTDDSTIARDIVMLSNGWLRAEPGTTGVYTGEISGARALSIGFLDWTGAVELRGANLFTGGVSVQTGTLQARNTTGSATGSGSVAVESGAVLGGDGAISGAVTIMGGATLAPGPDAATLSVGAATFQAGAAFSVELGGVDPGDFDRLSVSSAATLGGHLSASIIDGYTPVKNDEFEILTASTISGEFDTLDLPDGFEIDYFADRVVLRAASVAPPCLGDTNGDGVVNSADLGNLLSCWGAVPPGSVCESSDLNNDGNVNSQDLGALLGSWGVCP